MDSLLQDIPHVAAYLDDILITGKDNKEHLRNLDEVLHRLEEADQGGDCRMWMPSAGCHCKKSPHTNPWRGIAATRVLGHKLPCVSHTDPAVDGEGSNARMGPVIHAEGPADQVGRGCPTTICLTQARTQCTGRMLPVELKGGGT